MSIGHLSLLASILITLSFLVLGTILAIVLPRGDKRVAVYLFGIALFAGVPLILMALFVSRME